MEGTIKCIFQRQQLVLAHKATSRQTEVLAHAHALVFA